MSRKIQLDIVQLAELLKLAETTHDKPYAVRFLMEEAMKQPTAFYDMLREAGKELAEVGQARVDGRYIEDSSERRVPGGGS